jgi:Family of unknown function (DUF6311)
VLTTPEAQVGRLKPNGRLTVTARYCTLLIGGLLGLAWFTLVFGPSILNPTYLGWVMQGDGAQHVLGWLFFRHEPWSWPLGSVSSFPYPIGTTVGYTDSIPWVAILAKAISPFLPEDFQYIGLWLAVCFFLQGWFGVRIVQELSPHPLIHILGGACFILDPVLLWRIGHDSLCAHWLILGLIWLHLRLWPEGRTPHWALAMTLGFCLISAGVHPYLAMMVLGLALALVCKFHWVDHSLSARQMVLWGGGCGAATLGVFAALGYIGSGISWGAKGFGEYSADLLTLVNPAGTSRFLPALPSAPGQYEGFGYVGSGVLILGVIGIAIIWYNPSILGGRSLKSWVPLGICTALLAFFALSSRVTFAGKPILTLGHFYRPFLDIIAPFRTSGRFIWPLHYVSITTTLALWIVSFKTSTLIIYIVFSIIIISQILDYRGPFLQWYHGYHQRKQPFTLQVDDWRHAKGLYKHMVLYPPQIIGGDLPGCVMPEFEMDYYVPLAYQAYRLNMTFNNGYFARIDANKGRKYCKELHESMAVGRFDEDTIYVIHSQYWDLLKIHTPKITCGRLNDHIVCISVQNHDALHDYLVQRKVE